MPRPLTKQRQRVEQHIVTFARRQRRDTEKVQRCLAGLVAVCGIPSNFLSLQSARHGIDARRYDTDPIGADAVFAELARCPLTRHHDSPYERQRSAFRCPEDSRCFRIQAGLQGDGMMDQGDQTEALRFRLQQSRQTAERQAVDDDDAPVSNTGE